MINAFIWLAGGNLIVPTSFQMHETRTSLNDDHAHVEIIFYSLTFVNRVRALVVKVRLLLFSYLLSPRRSRKVGRKVPIYLPTYRVENHSKSTEWHTGKIARDGVREREKERERVSVSTLQSDIVSNDVDDDDSNDVWLLFFRGHAETSGRTSFSDATFCVGNQARFRFITCQGKV